MGNLPALLIQGCLLIHLWLSKFDVLYISMENCWMQTLFLKTIDYMAILKECCMASADIQWLFYSGEQMVTHGLLVFYLTRFTNKFWVQTFKLVMFQSFQILPHKFTQIDQL